MLDHAFKWQYMLAMSVVLKFIKSSTRENSTLKLNAQAEFARLIKQKVNLLCKSNRANLLASKKSSYKNQVIKFLLVMFQEL